MDEPSEPGAKTEIGSSIGLFLSLLIGGGAGYWAFTLDPNRTGGSILVFPAFIVASFISITFAAVGLITRNEAHGYSFVIGGIVMPFLFFITTNIFRFLFNV